MQSTDVPESGARARTRRAILDAAATALARDRAATLADIAAAADVGRSTLQRYFADREELLDAVVADSLRAIGRATAEAELDQGPPLEAMRRLATAMVDAGDRVLFLYGDPRVLERAGEITGGGSPEVTRLIERGQADGVFDPDASAAWIEHVLWALVYAGCDAAGRGTLPRHAAANTVIRTFENGVRRAEEGS
ncbi:MAG: TetR/AcrR family transcriptional regulator [Actinoallomurus sp.]